MLLQEWQTAEVSSNLVVSIRHIFILDGMIKVITSGPWVCRSFALVSLLM